MKLIKKTNLKKKRILEKNISGIDISILIALENKCFDLSDSKVYIQQLF
jgi:hypothetical protein